MARKEAAGCVFTKGVSMDRYITIKGDTFSILMSELRYLGNPSGIDFFFNDALNVVGIAAGEARTANVDIPDSYYRNYLNEAHTGGWKQDKRVDHGVQIRIPKLLEYEKALGLDTKKMYFIPCKEGEIGEKKILIYSLSDAVEAGPGMIQIPKGPFTFGDEG